MERDLYNGSLLKFILYIYSVDCMLSLHCYLNGARFYGNLVILL